MSRTARRIIPATESRAYVAQPSNVSSTSSSTLSDTSIFPVDPTVLALEKNALVEFTTRTVAVGGLLKSVVVPYQGASPTAVMGAAGYSVVTPSSADRTGTTSSSSAYDLTLSSVAATATGYYALFIHAGSSVTIGGQTFTNPNLAYDNTSTTGKRSTQMILCRFDSAHTFQYAYQPAAGQGITGPANTSTTEMLCVQSNVQLGYYSGIPSKVYLVGNFKGQLRFGGSGHNISSDVHSLATTNVVAFAAGFTENSGALTIDWATTLCVTASNLMEAAPTITQPVIAANSGIAIDGNGNPYFLIKTSTAQPITNAGDDDSSLITTTTLHIDSDLGGANSVAIQTITAHGTLTDVANVAAQSNITPVKLLGVSGAVDATFQAAVGVTASVTSAAAAVTAATVLTAGNIVSVDEASDYVAYAYDNATNTFANVRNTAGARTVGEVTVGAGLQPKIYHDNVNHVLLVLTSSAAAAAAGAGTLKLWKCPVAAATGIIAAATILEASVITGGLTNMTIRGIVSDDSVAPITETGAATNNIYFLLDFADVTAHALVETTNALTTTATSATTVFNTVLIGGGSNLWTAEVANSFIPHSLLQWTQSSSTYPGWNYAPGGFTKIGETALIVALGLASDTAYPDASSVTQTIPGYFNTAHSSYMSKGVSLDSTATVLVNLSQTESADRVLAFFDSAVLGATNQAYIRLPMPGRILDFTGGTVTLIPGTTYYASASTGEYTSTATSNTRIGVSVASTQLLLSDVPIKS